MDELFTGFCTEENHQANKLEHFCKTHNKLCCILCIGNNSQHKNCNICIIDDIKEEKKANLENNFKSLEKISNDIKETMNKIKETNEKMEEQKNELKTKIMKIMTNIRKN